MAPLCFTAFAGDTSTVCQTANLTFLLVITLLSHAKNAPAYLLCIEAGTAAQNITGVAVGNQHRTVIWFEHQIDHYTTALTHEKFVLALVFFHNLRHLACHFQLLLFAFLS